MTPVPRPPQHARRWCVLFALAALVFAQALGLLHGVAHAFHADATDSRPAAAHADHAPDASTSTWLGHLFASHDDAGDCRLADGLTQPGLVFAPLPLLLPQVPDLRHQRLMSGAFVARRAALFDARGPPLPH